MRWLFVVTPVVLATMALIIKSKNARVVAVLGILAVGLFSIPIAPHRIAEELRHGVPRTEEWNQGARATTDVVHSTIPAFLAVIGCLAALALLTHTRLPNQALQPTRPSLDVSKDP